MRVCARKCSECLYSKNRIVSADRAAEIMRKTARMDSHFICHKSQIRGDEKEAVCHGSLERPGNLLRIMGRLGGIQYIDPETGEDVDESEVDRQSQTA